MPEKTSGLILIGMHCSGANYLAARLEDSGVFFGKNTLGKTQAESTGASTAYEELSVMQLHNQLINEAVPDYANHYEELSSLVSSPLDLKFSPAHKQAATEISNSLQSKASANSTDKNSSNYWAWKDPRGSLFTNLWRDAVPDAHFLVLYSHPLSVLLNLKERAAQPENWLDYDELRSFKAYSAYYLSILKTAKKHPEHFTFISGETLDNESSELESLLTDKFQIKLAASGSNKFELSKLNLSQEIIALFSSYFPKEQKLYDELESLSSVSTVNATSQAPASNKSTEALDELLQNTQLDPATALRLLLHTACSETGIDFAKIQQQEVAKTRERFSYLKDLRKVSQENQDWAEREQQATSELKEWAKREQKRAEESEGQRDWWEMEFHKLKTEAEANAFALEDATLALKDAKSQMLEGEMHSLPSGDVVDRGEMEKRLGEIWTELEDSRTDRARLEDEHYRSSKELRTVKTSSLFRFLRSFGFYKEEA